MVEENGLVGRPFYFTKEKIL